MSSQPNVLLVTTDSLRADYIYSDKADTPHHDALAEESLVYEHAFAQGPFTTFSMPSLFTGRYPSGLQYVEFSDSTIGVYIDDEPTLGTILHDSGYQTAGFHSNPLLSNLFGFDHGFDVFDARLPLSNTDLLPGRAKILTDKLKRLVRKHPYLPAEKLTDRGLDWLDGCKGDRPFFLWLHYMDVHGPYQAKTGNTYFNKYRGERLWRKAQRGPDALSDAEHDRLLELYCEEVEYTDTHIGRLFEGLRERGLFEETLTVVTADHGEQFGEYGAYSHPHVCHDVLTHVPLLVHHPENKAERIDDVVELVGASATIAKQGSGSVPQSFAGDPLPRANRNRERPLAISEADLSPAYHGSVRSADWRYIRNDVAGVERLCAMNDASGKKPDRGDDQPAVQDELAAILEEHLASSDRSATDEGVETAGIEDTDVRNRLKNLGYLE